MLRRGSVLTLFALAPALSSCAQHVWTVDPGDLYRSGQLDGAQLEEAIERYRIRTIINLRGENPGKAWYDEERAVAEAHGVTLVDIGMSARRLPHRDDLVRLLDAFHEAERPILVHCYGGVDRTGEACAIYSMEHLGESREEALRQLSFCFGHLPFIYPAKRYFIGLWEGEEWARSEYDPCSGEYPYYDVTAEDCEKRTSESAEDEEEPPRR